MAKTKKKKQLKTKVRKVIAKKIKRVSKSRLFTNRGSSTKSGPKKVLRKKNISKKKIKKIVKKPKKILRKTIKRKSVKSVKLKKKVIKNKSIRKIIKKKKSVKKSIVKRARKILKPKKVKVLKKKNRPVKQHKSESSILGMSPESLFRAKIKVIGIGGGGGSIVSEIYRSMDKATFAVADTDLRALKKRPGIKYLWFGESFTRGLGTGLNVELAKKAAEESKDKIRDIVKEQDIVIFVSSLGGGVGSGATQVFAKAAREFGGITLGIFTLPFKFEGQNKHKIARDSLKTLRENLNVSLVLPNEKIFKIIDENTSITDAFSMVNKSLIESLESLIDLIYSPGIINIDFADLRTILKGLGNDAFLNTIEESGKNRAEKICEKILVNPLLQQSNVEAEKILLNIAGSGNISMLEVEKISRHVSELNPKAKIIFGISRNNKLKNKIKATILVTGGGKGGEVPVKGIVKEIKKEEVKLVEAKEEIYKKKSKKISKKNKLLTPKLKEAEEVPIRKEPKEAEEEKVSLVPVFKAPALDAPVVEESKLSIIKIPEKPPKATIRRNALEIRKAEDLAEKKRQEQEKEWEIPAFLRKIKYKSQ